MLASGVEMAAACLCPLLFGGLFQGFKPSEQLTIEQKHHVSVIADLVLVYVSSAARSIKAPFCLDAPSCLEAGLPLGMACRNAHIWEGLMLEIWDAASAASDSDTPAVTNSWLQGPSVAAFLQESLMKGEGIPQVGFRPVAQHNGTNTRSLQETSVRDPLKAVSEGISIISRVFLEDEGQGTQLIERVAQYAHVAHHWTADAIAVASGAMSPENFRYALKSTCDDWKCTLQHCCSVLARCSAV